MRKDVHTNVLSSHPNHLVDESKTKSNVDDPHTNHPVFQISKHTKLSVDESSTDKNEAVSSSSFWKQVWISASISLIELSGGTSYAFTGIVLPSLTNPDSPDYMNTQQVSLYTSMLLVGGLVGSLICGPLLIRLGHKTVMFLTIPLSVTGWLISYFSHVFWPHLLSRFLNGMFCSIAIGSSSPYISEVVHPSIRGRFLAFTDLSRQIGMLYVFLVGSTHINWRTVGMICGVLPLVVPLAALFFVPNSPRWLACKGYPDEDVIKSLKYFRGVEHDVTKEFDMIKNELSQSKEHSTVLNQLKILKERSVGKRFALLLFLNIAMPCTGAYVIPAFYTSIFKAATPTISPYLSTIICGVIRIFGAITYIVITDHIGRRRISTTFLGFCCFSTICMGLYFYLKDTGHSVSGIFWLPLASMILLTLSICLCLPVIRTLRSELMPNSVRGLAVNLVFASSSLATYTMVISYPYMEITIGIGFTFWMFSSVALAMVIVIYFFLPETKGKSLEEIELMFK